MLGSMSDRFSFSSPCSIPSTSIYFSNLPPHFPPPQKSIFAMRYPLARKRTRGNLTYATNVRKWRRTTSFSRCSHIRSDLVFYSSSRYICPGRTFVKSHLIALASRAKLKDGYCPSTHRTSDLSRVNTNAIAEDSNASTNLFMILAVFVFASGGKF